MMFWTLSSLKHFSQFLYFDGVAVFPHGMIGLGLFRNILKSSWTMCFWVLALLV
jgi:hypothetical protein